VLDAIRITEHIEHVGAPARRGAETILRQIGELDAIVGEHGVDFVGDGFDQSLEEVCRDPAIGLLVQFGVDEFGCSIDGNEQVELAFLGSYLGNVDVEVADGIGLELLLRGLVALRLRQAADPMAPEATMQG